MKKSALFLASLLATASLGAQTDYRFSDGGRPVDYRMTADEVFSRALALSGGRSAIVAVLPQTFPTDSIADAAVTMWTTFRAREVMKVSRTDPERGRTTAVGGFRQMLVVAFSVPSARMSK